MKKLILFLLLVLSSIHFANACSCVPLGQLTIKDFNQTDAMFIGKVKSVKPFPLTDSVNAGKVEVVFEVGEAFKGLSRAKDVKIYTQSSSAACGIYFRKGEQWMVFATKYDTGLHANMCGRSRNIAFAKKDDLELLRSFSARPSNKIWLVQGVKRGEGTLRNNIPEGKWKYYSATGALIEEGGYLKGIVDGQWTTYIDTLNIERYLKDNQYVSETAIIHKKDYSNKISAIINYKNGVLHGESINFNEASFRPWRVQTYVDGELEGQSIDYHFNGLVSEVAHYQNGNLEGFSRAYYPNGQLIFEGNYTNNISGGFKLYDESGKFIGTSVNRPYYEPMDKKYVLNN
jgi:antitoxin component YwqK of YwqJK toxin-antitoxin module